MAEGADPKGGPGEDRGVFGNLPSARPGTRSPRRKSGNAEGKAAEPETGEPAPAVSSPRAAPHRPQTPPPPPREPEAPEPGDEREGGVEDLAWAGITVAAEAATLGVRLLTRAVEAVRRPSDRR